MFRERREERRGERGADHYRMRQKLVSIGDDYWIENDRGERVYKVDGKALRLRQTLIFEDARGAELVKIQERMLHARDTMEIEDRDGNRVATVKKALITPLRERWTVTVADGPDLEVKGNIVDHEYTIEDGRTKAAEVSKSWFRISDTYGVEVAPGQDPVVILAVTAVLDHHGPPGALIAGVGPGRSAVTGPGDRRCPARPPASGEAAGPLRASGERECRSPKASGGPYGIDARAYEVGLP